MSHQFKIGDRVRATDRPDEVGTVDYLSRFDTVYVRFGDGETLFYSPDNLAPEKGPTNMFTYKKGDRVRILGIPAIINLIDGDIGDFTNVDTGTPFTGTVTSITPDAEDWAIEMAIAAVKPNQAGNWTVRTVRESPDASWSKAVRLLATMMAREVPSPDELKRREVAREFAPNTDLAYRALCRKDGVEPTEWDHV